MRGAAHYKERVGAAVGGGGGARGCLILSDAPVDEPAVAARLSTARRAGVRSDASSSALTQSVVGYPSRVE